MLIQSGDTTVVRKLSQNQGAFFPAGLATLTKRAEADEHLAENLTLRLDLPPQQSRSKRYPFYSNVCKERARWILAAKKAGADCIVKTF